MSKRIKLGTEEFAKKSAKTKDKYPSGFKAAELYDAGGDVDKEWYVYFFVYNPNTGKFERIKYSKDLNKLTRLGQTKMQRKKRKYAIAEVIINTINHQLESGYNPYHHNTIIVEFNRPALDVWRQVIDAIKNRLEIRTFNQYRNTITAFEKFLKYESLETYTIDQLDKTIFYKFQDYCFNELRVTKNVTINSHLTYLNAISNHAINRGLASMNPFSGIKKLREQETEQFIPWTEEEKQQLANRLPAIDFPLWVYANIIYCTGLRPYDIQRLKIKHFDLINGEVIIPGSSSKNDTGRKSVLPKFCCDIIQKHIEGYSKDYVLFSKDMLPGESPIVRNRISERWLKVVKKQLGINKNAYALKHTMVIDLSKGSVSSKQIQQQIGHHSLEMTDKYARKFSTNDLQKLKENFPTLGNNVIQNNQDTSS